jgi:hypothetical protein
MLATVQTGVMTFELRTYNAIPGRLDDLLARFRDHTVELFAKHGIVSVGYWVPVETPDQLIYVVRHEGDAKQNWLDFQADKQWIEAKAASVANGEIVAGITSVYLEATDFSAIR